ncbi:MAG: hypothetical protein ACLTMP_01860 [Eggerthella lenta]
MNASDRRDERGSALPLVLVAALALFAVLAFSVDQGIAYAAKARQENALDAARAACMDASFALVAKNADDPRMVADRVVRTARDAGFEGRRPCGSTKRRGERLFDGAPLGRQDAVRGGVSGVRARKRHRRAPVASYRVLTAMPYAGERCGGRKRGAADDTTTRRTIRPGVRGAELARRLSAELPARATLAESGNRPVRFGGTREEPIMVMGGNGGMRRRGRRARASRRETDEGRGWKRRRRPNGIRDASRRRLQRRCRLHGGSRKPAISARKGDTVRVAGWRRSSPSR